MTPEELKTERILTDLNKELDESLRRFDASFLRLLYSTARLSGTLHVTKFVFGFNAIFMALTGEYVVACIVGFLAIAAYLCEKKVNQRFEEDVQKYSFKE